MSRRNAHGFVAVRLFLVWTMGLGSIAVANGLTEAGTTVQIIASISATDSIGRAVSATDTLSAVVLPVRGARLSPEEASVLEADAVAGTRVDFPFTVTNIGNTSASMRLAFERTDVDLAGGSLLHTVVRDAACDGAKSVGDTVLDLSAAGSHLTLAYGEQACLVLSITVDGEPSAELTQPFSLIIAALLGDEPLAPGAASANQTFRGDLNLLVETEAFEVISEDLRVQPGTPGRLLVRVRNIENVSATSVTIPSSTDQFNLAFVASPAGYEPAVTFHEASCDGGTGQTPGTPVNQVGPLSPTDFACVLVQVPVARSAVSGAQFQVDNDVQNRRVRLSATRESDPERFATLSRVIDVVTTEGVTFGPAQTSVIGSPEAVILRQTLTNTGNTAGIATLGRAEQNPSGSGTVSYSLDGVSYTPTLRIPLAPAGGSGGEFASSDRVEVYVRFESAAGLLGGTRIRTSIPVAMEYLGPGNQNVGSASAVSVASFDVVTGSIRVEVASCSSAVARGPCVGNDGSEALSGEFLHYTVTLRNDGNAAVSNVVLTQPLPIFTRFASVSASANFDGTVLYSVNGTDFADAAPTSLRTGGAIAVGVKTSASPETSLTSQDVIPPGGTITLRMVVEVR